MEIQQFDLNLLRALDALLHERNVTRAAERLHVTQQAMSGALRRLREHFDDPLLLRIGRGFEPTPQAAALIGPVRDALLRIERALQIRPTFEAASSERRFAIAMSDYAAITLLPAVMARLSVEAPNLVLDVKLIDSATIDEIERGDLDLCLLPSDWTLFRDWRPRDVRSAPLYGDDFVCVAGAGNRAVGDAIDAGQYCALPHAALRLGGGVSSVVEAAWRELAIAPRIAATATSFAGLVLMVSESRLISTVQRRLAQRFARMLPIRVLECPIAIEPLSGSMSWHLAHEEDPAHRYLRDVFAGAGAEADNRHL